MRADQLEYYLRLGEVDRLSAHPRGRLELLRTREIVEPLLPTTARVLDVGGGTGVHARWMAEAGHDVLVIDPVREQVAIAARIPGVRAVVGDARGLDVPDASADVVLLLGPLYHLLDPDTHIPGARLAGVEGVGTHLLPFDDPVAPALWDSAVRLARYSERITTLMAAGSHVLGLARRDL